MKTCDSFGIKRCSACAIKQGCVINNWISYLTFFHAESSDRKVIERIMWQFSLKDIRHGIYSPQIAKAIELTRPNMIDIMDKIELLQ